MTLRHMIDWNGKYSNITANIDHSHWSNLKGKYVKSISIYDLILYSLQERRYNVVKQSVNRIIRNKSLQLPKGDHFVLQNKTPSLVYFLYSLYKCSQTHTAYAFLALKLVCEFYQLPVNKFANLTVGCYNKGIIDRLDVSLPEWLTIILDRQKSMALSIGLGDNDPLFYVMRYTDMKKTSMYARAIKPSDPEINDVLYKFRMRYVYSISEYMNNFRLFCGMKSGAFLQVDQKEHHSFTYDNKMIGRLVTVYTYINNRKRVFDFGYVISKKNNLYLIHTKSGLFWCPYYLLGAPVVRNREKDIQMKLDLHKMGYYPLEFYENIKSHKELRQHKITLRKLHDEGI